MVNRKIEAFLSELDELGVKLWMDGDRLRSRAPKGALTARLRQELRGRKEEVVAFLRQAHAPEVEISQIWPTSRSAPIPLSFAQQRLWFLAQLDKQSSAYNAPVAMRLKGELILNVLRESITEIVRRHETLRTTFEEVAGQAIQVISPSPTFEWTFTDLSHLPTTQRDAEMERLAVQAHARVFDLVKGPLVRVLLLRLDALEHLLLIVMPHLITDGWSNGILQQELSALYEAYAASTQRGLTKASPLPPLPIQYADFASWQRERLQTGVWEQELTYWQKQLADAPPLLTLPTDHARPAMQRYSGGHYWVTLPKELLMPLKALSKEANATLFMTLQAAFAVLLSRYSGQKDILVGTPVANRNRVEVESLIGFFVNTLVLRTRLEGNPTFREVMSQVRQTALEAYQQQELPFDLLVERLQPERSLSHNPLFQAMFVLQNTAQQEMISDLSISPVELNWQMSLFDLSLSLEEKEEFIRCCWEYSEELFERATIERMAGHFQTLLANVVANPNQPIALLPLLTESEKHQLLVEWNDTNQNLSDKCIHQLFEEQVERTPNAVAVVFGDQQLTYRELNTRANQLAHYLIAQGVGPDVLVAICIERSIEMVVGLLAILKAGGAYVPLDPTYPSQRLNYMLHDSKAPILLTEGKAASYHSFQSPTLRHKIYLDSQWEEQIAPHATQNPIRYLHATDLAYCIYTSGSTGKPKGVLIEHKSIVNFTHTAIAEYQISASDRVLQFASISFDTAAEEIYPCLSRGGMLVLRSEHMLNSVSAFIETSQALKLTVWDLPTAYWHLITNVLSQGQLMLPDSLRLVIIGGERALPERVRQWNQCVGTTPQLLNTYGPTEATVIATTCSLSGLSLPDGQEVPIGRPIGNVKLYLLDQYRQPVPIGVPGELYIGGAGVARGYLNRPELTKEKFIPNPFAQDSSERLYKTGDLCRYMPDGNVEFLGRLDYQVKIRGFRIELGEIEAVLAEHPDVREALVIAREAQPNDNDTGFADKRLVAYLIGPRANDIRSEPIIGQLRQHLHSKLPHYMIPSAFVFLDALPLTPNGKVDRQALPAPVRQHREETLVSPHTPTEMALAHIWSDLLGIEQIDIHDNFFELGGHSLLATQVVSRIRNALSIDISLRDFFVNSTVFHLSEHIKTYSLMKSVSVTSFSENKEIEEI